MYETPRGEEPGGCRETWVLTLAAFAVLMPPLLALAAVLGALVAVLILLTVHPALALLPIAALVVSIYLFARWEQRRFRPPDR
jgi:hypothetical protein